jgi:hypothetical protein
LAGRRQLHHRQHLGLGRLCRRLISCFFNVGVGRTSTTRSGQRRNQGPARQPVTLRSPDGLRYMVLVDGEPVSRVDVYADYPPIHKVGLITNWEWGLIPSVFHDTAHLTPSTPDSLPFALHCRTAVRGSSRTAFRPTARPLARRASAPTALRAGGILLLHGRAGVDHRRGRRVDPSL